MKNRYEMLFSPGKINSLTLKNRIILPPMGFCWEGVTGETAPETIEFLSRCARGGAALVITVSMFTQCSHHRPSRQEIDLHQDPRTYSSNKIDLRKSVSRLYRFLMEPYAALNGRLFYLTEAVHRNGGLIAAALNPTPLGWILQNYDPDNEEYQSLGLFNKMSVTEIEDVVQEFATVAGELKRFGFDAIEISTTWFAEHFALGTYNRRTDKYGGSNIEGRLRFHEELIKATRNEVGRYYPIMLLIDADHYGAPGWRSLEESKVMVKKFEEWGIDCVRARGGGAIKVQYEIAPQYLPLGINIPLAAGLKQVVNIPVIANTKLTDPDLAESVLREGKADFISIGRGMIADHQLPNKWKSDQADRVRKCIYCNIGCYLPYQLQPPRASHCTVNPSFGNETRFPEIVVPARISKKVVVVGAGPSGMSAALTACRRGHRVVMFEKTGSLGGGGQFKLACLAPFKKENEYIPEYYAREFKKEDNLEIKFNVEAEAAMIMAENPDTVIVATGARAQFPELPGATTNAVTYEDVLLGRVEVGGHALIIGGGSVGCETAIFLASKNKKVSILEMLDRVADDLENATRNCLIDELKNLHVDIFTGAKATSVEPGLVRYLINGELFSIEGDTVVTATGAQSEVELYNELSQDIPNVCLIGDAKEPRHIYEAISEGYWAAHYLVK